jgi:hypothetical protein
MADRIDRNAARHGRDDFLLGTMGQQIRHIVGDGS